MALSPEDHLENAISDLRAAIKGFQLRGGERLNTKLCKEALHILGKDAINESYSAHSTEVKSLWIGQPTQLNRYSNN